MWKSVSKANWDNVILEDAKKKAIQNDVLRFFRAEDRYKGLGVPWKRGVIVSCVYFVKLLNCMLIRCTVLWTARYVLKFKANNFIDMLIQSTGNGKTISIKAVLNQMSSMKRPVSITSLYVRSLAR